MTLAILPSTEETPIWPENIFRIAWSERVGLTVSFGYAKARLGYLALHLADLAKAGDYLRQALINFYKFGHTYVMAVTLDWLASLAAAESRWAKAALLFGYTTKQYEQILGLRPPVEQKDVEKVQALIRSQLGQAEWSGLSAQGSSLTIAEAIRLGST